MPVSNKKPTRWSLTVWMPPYTEESAKEMLERAIQVHPRWSIEGQLEKGKSSDGKFHYQLLVKTDQQRHSALRKAFPSCHIEEARNAVALEQYVHKDDTRVAEFKKIESRFVQWPELRKKFFEWLIRTEDVAALSYVQEYERLKKWDEFIGLSIEEGIEVDILGVNPQYRSCIIRYWNAYVRRGVEVSRQTPVDIPRQTDTLEVSLPMLT